MIRLDHYMRVGQKHMRCGYTTGTCAAAAARASAQWLLSGVCPDVVKIHTPAGIDVIVEIERPMSGQGWRSCAVRKDAGDDPDVTDGALVFARVSVSDICGIHIDGGKGIGRITQDGLDQPVGAAAINHVPREMICEQVQLSMDTDGYTGGLDVLISIPAGVDLAAKTFNPRLGIVGGISVLGTAGIVKPMSEDALIASIELELKMLHARGVQNVLVTPGNYGRNFARDALGIDLDAAVQCSNYLGATLDACVELGFATLLYVGHLGKLVKVAAGIMNTHSRVADARRETLAAHAASAGASRNLVQRIMSATTTDEIVGMLDEERLREPVMASICDAVVFQLDKRSLSSFQSEVIIFSNTYGELARSAGACELVNLHATHTKRTQ